VADPTKKRPKTRKRRPRGRKYGTQSSWVKNTTEWGETIGRLNEKKL